MLCTCCKIGEIVSLSRSIPSFFNESAREKIRIVDIDCLPFIFASTYQPFGSLIFSLHQMDLTVITTNNQVQSIDLMAKENLKNEMKTKKSCQCSVPHCCSLRIVIRNEISPPKNSVPQLSTKATQCRIGRVHKNEKKAKKKRTIKVNRQMGFDFHSDMNIFLSLTSR